MTTQATFEQTTKALTGEALKPLMSQQASKAVVDALIAQGKADDKWVRSSDILFAEGITSKILSGAVYRERFEREVILLCLPKEDQRIYKAVPASLSLEERTAKEKIKPKLNAKFKLVLDNLKKREKLENQTPEERIAELEAQAKASTMEAKLSLVLDDWVTKVQEAEEVGFSATKMVEYLKAARALIK